MVRFNLCAYFLIFQAKIFRCKCGEKFSYRKNLLAHERQLHSEELVRYSCPQCRKSYTTKYSLKYHLRDEHSIKLDLKNVDLSEDCVNATKNTRKCNTLLFSLVFSYFVLFDWSVNNF